MGTLYLVRHGQASFGAADYDQLSDLGERQCLRLGEHLRARGLQFEAAISGTLKRHRQSLEAIEAGLDTRFEGVARLPGLDEYDSEAVVRALHPQPPPPPAGTADFKHHFRLLREGLLAWMHGETEPEGLGPHQRFVDGVAEALEHVRSRHAGDVLLVSSGGPISHAVGVVLGLAPEAVVELNLRIRNSAVTEFLVTPKRHALVGFNSIAHLEQPGLGPEWVTYA